MCRGDGHGKDRLCWGLGPQVGEAPAHALLRPAWSLGMEMIQLKGWEMRPLILDKGVEERSYQQIGKSFVCVLFQISSVPRQEAYLDFKENESLCKTQIF